MDRIELPKLDVSKYIGTETKIVSATVESMQYGAVLKLQTAPIELKDGDRLPEGKQLTASILLSLIEKDNKLTVGIDTKADKWFKKHKVNIAKLPEVKPGDRVTMLEGMTVKVQENIKTGYLEIA